MAARGRHRSYAETVSTEDQRHCHRERATGNPRDEGWEKVRNKRHCYSNREQRSGQEERRSPPVCRSSYVIRIPTGMITVCGQCLRPGHRAMECRRAATCRICGEVGHKSPAFQKRRPRTEANTGPIKSRRAPAYKKPNKNRGTTMDSRNGQNHKHTSKGLPPAVTEAHQPLQDVKEEAKHHHISLALNIGMMEGKERMKRFLIISLPNISVGKVDGEKMEEMLKEIVDENWTWVLKPLRDGRFIMHYRSVSLVWNLVNSG
ncbi:hypothetical protein J5N97_009397 [Dioscorea zingiberensis]|uniref:CCHC-type domain-containing protein n=1 Tax=Dioscorea zingiberensis TaxID=325984 RepID=A0A9D5CY53_9LILI|nr:hypothetical protein J5N97_009397 [Dioscorea zingiberensis]